jgi:hypothetical protein
MLRPEESRDSGEPRSIPNRSAVIVPCGGRKGAHSVLLRLVPEGRQAPDFACAVPLRLTRSRSA